MISHGSARYAPAELAALNARLLHAMSYEVAKPRLPASVGAEAWDVLRANLASFGDVAQWAAVLSGDAPRIDQPDDTEFLTTAREMLPAEPWDETTWSAWTGALKDKTGRKGRALF